MAKLELKSISKKYRGSETYSVQDFNLAVEEGEFIVFVGPSGCGKSTTLRMIAGLESITEGDMLLNGKRVNDLEPKDRSIAMVFQNYALFPHLTVRDNIGFGLKIRGVKKAELNQRVEETAAMVGLTDYLDRRPGELSGGQNQRVALARAIVKEADLYLMDEPLSNLDAKLRVQMRNEISNLQRKMGATTIYVTHDQAEAMTMASRIVVMSAGIVQQIGTPFEIYNDPHNVFVAGFLGSPSMNFFKVQLSMDQLITTNLNKKSHQILLKDERLTALPEGEYILGVRPEHVDLSKGDIPFQMTNTELMGDKYHLHGTIANHPVVLTTDADRPISSDDDVRVSFNFDHIYLFNADSEQRVYVNE